MTDRERLELFINQVLNMDNLFEIKTIAHCHALEIGFKPTKKESTD